MAAVLQTIFSNALSWIQMYEFCSKFHWSLFLGFQLTIFQHWFRYWLGAVQATSHYLNQWWVVYRRIYASLGLSELKDAFDNMLEMLAICSWPVTQCFVIIVMYSRCINYRKKLNSWSLLLILHICPIFLRLDDGFPDFCKSKWTGFSPPPPHIGGNARFCVVTKFFELCWQKEWLHLMGNLPEGLNWWQRKCHVAVLQNCWMYFRSNNNTLNFEI